MDGSQSMKRTLNLFHFLVNVCIKLNVEQMPIFNDFATTNNYKSVYISPLISMFLGDLIHGPKEE